MNQPPSKKTRRLSVWALIIAGSLAVAGEVGLRLSGVIDFPTYDTDGKIGYIPKPSQEGSFLNKNRWALNSLSMNISEEWSPNGDKDVLLIGDSIVWGGNPYDQPEKLGPQLQGRLPGWKVWPIGAGSWSVQNEQVWLDRHPEVVKEADVVVWVINSGDFYQASQWASELTHPRAKPVSALWYSAGKYLSRKLKRRDLDAEAAISPAAMDTAIAQAWADRLSQFNGRVIVVCWPAKNQNRSDSVNADEAKVKSFTSFLAMAKAAEGKGATVISMDGEPGWSGKYYRDGIHPTPEGFGYLAEKLSKMIPAH